MGFAPIKREVPNDPREVTLIAMDLDRLPVQVQALLRRLAQVVASREPAIQNGIQALRAKHPHLTSDQLAMELIRSTRRRVAATGAISGAASIAPGVGTVLAIGTITSQAFYALEQEVELVLAIAIVYGHELSGSEDRVLEALVVVGIASGALKLRSAPSRCSAHSRCRSVYSSVRTALASPVPCSPWPAGPARDAMSSSSKG